jgi:aspartyl protease family protein
MLGWLVLAFLLLTGLFLALRSDPTLLANLASGDTVLLVVGGLVAAAYVWGLMGSNRSRIGAALRHLTVWVALLLSLVAGYTYRDELTMVANRVAGELALPGQPIVVEMGEAGEKAVRIRRGSNGHFIARSDVNGVPASFLVDTGASTVVLRPADAEKIGLDTRHLNYSVPVQTANGTTYAAPIRLRTLGIGPIIMHDVEALVAKPGTLKESLLGMSFLRRLRSYEFSGDFLTLRS